MLSSSVKCIKPKAYPIVWILLVLFPTLPPWSSLEATEVLKLNIRDLSRWPLYRGHRTKKLIKIRQQNVCRERKAFQGLFKFLMKKFFDFTSFESPLVAFLNENSVPKLAICENWLCQPLGHRVINTLLIAGLCNSDGIGIRAYGIRTTQIFLETFVVWKIGFNILEISLGFWEPFHGALNFPLLFLSKRSVPKCPFVGSLRMGWLSTKIGDLLRMQTCGFGVHPPLTFILCEGGAKRQWFNIGTSFISIALQ